MPLRQIGTSPLVSPRNDVCETIAELNSILMTDLGSASDWLKEISLSVRPIRITTQIWEVTHFCSHFLDVISRRETGGGVAKCPLFSQPNMAPRLSFCISSHLCRIKILLAKLHLYSLQTARCYAWHQFKSTLCSR